MAKKAATKSEIFGNIAKATELSRKQVASVFEALNNEIKNNLGKKGAGIFTLPGLAKIKVVKKPAVPAGNRMNPFTKQMQMMPAKPARNVVKVRPLKNLKDMVK